MDATQKHVLDGYKVLDFTQFVAGPTCTLMMAEMGAEVIKVEFAPRGDPTRAFPIMRDGRSGYFVQHNRGKQSLCVDLKRPEAAELIRELIRKVDVLVQNYAPGVIGRMGFDYESVSALNPRIVMCSISGFGQTGPLAHLTGYDGCGQAVSGFTSMCGEPGEAPYLPMVALGDVSTGAHAMGAVACALLYRERTGKGQHLDISLLDTYFHYHEAAVQMASLSGGEIEPTRSGRHAYYVAPAGIFKGRDGHLIIAAVDHQWTALCNAMGRPELAHDPRFDTNAARVANLKEMTVAIEDWLASVSDNDAMELLDRNRVPFAPILSVREAMNHPHLRERGTVRKVRDRVLGEFDLPGFALRFSEFKNALTLDAPFLGEHNERVLTSYLGYTGARVAELERGGVLCSGPR
ncbi:MAG TPA: CoA transferase [Candidatus Binataceae bacterium]|jgi:crotonobetainyl-CoA:carnitine CoA-transferase CaiB-like acyl-CoA transferase|nr:CoA transferase [Candidatus Binataceae bacterium]